MSEPIDPYSPPTANLQTAPAPTTDSVGAPFFATSVTKVWLYSFATLSVYLFYWNYKQWKAWSTAKGRDVSSFWRAFFSVFFVFELFPALAATANMQVNATGLAALYAGASVISNVGSRFNDTLGLIGLVAIYPIAAMQAGLNEHLQKAYPSLDRNEKIGAGGIILLMFGAILWLLILAGALLPDPS